MTSLELRDLLAQSLADLLGTYRGEGVTRPAIWWGEPPDGWTATGLEVRVDVIPDLRQVPAHQRGVIDATHNVRLVSHGDDTRTLEALYRILARWPDAQAAKIPANERLGILHQHTVTIPA